MTIKEEISGRVLVLDGAMGTMIQGYQLNEEDYRGEKFNQWGYDLKGNHDILSITRPETIREIHDAYLSAGADIIETNTFNANAISQSDYGLKDYIYEMNKASAVIARACADAFTDRDTSRPRYVAGAMGPTHRTASLFGVTGDPGDRRVDFRKMQAAYYDQARGLVDGGADALLIETVYNLQNAKAALLAIRELPGGKSKKIPVMVSATLTANGRALPMIESLIAAVSGFDLLCLGLNCVPCNDETRTILKEISRKTNYYICFYPNAGSPGPSGEYGVNPEQLSGFVGDLARDHLVNIVGGCCGTTPDHIYAISKAVGELRTNDQGK